MEFYKSSFLRVADELSRVGYYFDCDDRKRIDGMFYVTVHINNCQDVSTFESWKDAYTWLCGFKTCVKCHPVIR